MPAFDLEAVKRVPKIVWVVGGGIIVGFVLLTRKSGSPVAGVGSTIGAGAGQGDQPTVSSTDLSMFLTDQQQAQNDFYQSIIDAINGGTGTPSGGGTGGASGSIPVPGGSGTRGPVIGGGRPQLPSTIVAPLATFIPTAGQTAAWMAGKPQNADKLPSRAPTAPYQPAIGNRSAITTLRHPPHGTPGG